MEEGGSSLRCLSPQLLGSDNADIRGRCLGMMSSASHLQMGEFACISCLEAVPLPAQLDVCHLYLSEYHLLITLLFTGSRSLVLFASCRRLRKEEIYCCLASYKWQFLVIISPVLCNMLARTLQIMFSHKKTLL